MAGQRPSGGRVFPRLGEKIAVLRKRQVPPWGQADLAQQAGLTLDRVRRVERGEDLKLTTLHALARALGTTVVDLVSPLP